MASSSLWAGLGALGDAAVGIGTGMLKSHLANKLEQQREARAAEREATREAGIKVERDSEGVTWVQGINSAGRNIGAPTLASAQDIKNYNQEENTKQTKMSLDALTLLGKEREAADYEEDKGLERAAKQAQIDQMADASKRAHRALEIQAQEANDRRAGIGGYARSGRASEGTDTGVFNSSNLTEGFLGTEIGKNLMKEYVEGDSPKMSREKFLQTVNGGFLLGKQNRQDAIPLIRSALRGVVSRKTPE